MEKVIFYMPHDTIMDFSGRDLGSIELKQKEFWRKDLPEKLVKILRRIGICTTRVAMDAINDAGKYDLAIIPEWQLTPTALTCILRKPIAPRQIVMFRNAVDKSNSYIVEKADKGNLEIYTYNIGDFEKYGIPYHGQCWNKNLCFPMVETVTSDLYFVGKAKSRYHYIIKMKEEAERQSLKTDFTIVSTKGEPMTTQTAAPYTTCVEHMKASRAILDIVGEDNNGLTLRPLEALFLKKKLVTNYLDIKKYDFFAPNRENIFLIGVDRMEDLADFVRAPFVESDFSIDNYDIVPWLKRFVNR